MIIIPQQLIALLPLLIIGLTVVIIVLSIAWQRNHFVNMILTVIGLNLAMISLWFVGQVGPMDVTPMLRIDSFSIFYTGLVLLASLATCIFAYPWLQSFSDNCDEFYLLILIAVMGGIVLTGTNHITSLFIGIELLSLPLFGLIGYAFRQQASLEAALKYTILSAVASSFLLFGIALVYADSGSLSFIELGKNLIDSTIHHQPLLMAGLGIMIIGLCFKLSLVPCHLWTPDVYHDAPTSVSAFLATTSKIAIFSALMRMFTYVPITNSENVRNVLVIIAVISIMVGNLLAMSQSNIKRLLGYSSISHIGYLIVTLITIQSHQISLETASVYLVSYLFSNLGTFGIINIMSNTCQSRNADLLYYYRGLFWHYPVLSLVMMIMMLSLAGIPITLGFISKLYVITLGINASLWWLISATVLGSALSLYYYMRVSIILFLNPPKLHVRNILLNNWALTASGLVVLISAILVVLLGIYPQPLINLAQLAQLLI